MGTALINTLMGISIVFVVLLVISGIIGLFKYINKAEMASKQKNTANAAHSESVLAAAEDVDLSNDLELVAVITAAIHAYETSRGNNIPVNELYVRSIRKVNKSRWQNA